MAFPVWGIGNKCRTRYLTVIWRASKKKIFIGSRNQQHITKGFRESENKFAMLKKFIRSKISQSTVSFSSFQLWSSLETGHCVCLEVVSTFPPLVLVKKRNTAKGKEAFQGKFVVIIERIRSLIFIGKTSRISASSFSSSIVICFKIFKHRLGFSSSVRLQFLHQLRSH